MKVELIRSCVLVIVGTCSLVDAQIGEVVGYNYTSCMIDSGSCQLLWILVLATLNQHFVQILS